MTDRMSMHEDSLKKGSSITKTLKGSSIAKTDRQSSIGKTSRRQSIGKTDRDHQNKWRDSLVKGSIIDINDRNDYFNPKMR